MGKIVATTTMKRLVSPLIVIVLVAGCLEANPETSASPSAAAGAVAAVAPSFAVPTKVQDTSSSGAEPAVATHPDGTLFVLVWTQLHRSTDGGKTFTRLTTPFKNNGDSDLAITPDGVLHYVGMTLAGQAGEPRLPYFRSSDKGDTWSAAQDLSKGPANNVDRQFITYADGLLVLTWNDITADENLVRVSKDTGKTWSEPQRLKAPRAKTVGAPAIFGQTILQPLNLKDHFEVARSTDGGATWKVIPGPATKGQLAHMPQIAFDKAGTGHFAGNFLEGSAKKISVWSSTDKGATWPTTVSVSPASSESVFPWIVAGDAGHVAVSFYERDLTKGPTNAPWYPHVAVTNTADLGTGWTGKRIVSEPIRTKDICSGDQCSADLWSFKDLFEMGVTKEGRPFAAWMKETAPTSTPLPFVGGSSAPTLSVQAAAAVDGWKAFG